MIAIPEFVDRLGIAAVVALALSGVPYSAGAVIYARRRRDPAPTVFGYDELLLCW